MAFVLNDVYKFGNGTLDDVTISDGATDKINSYAKVTAIAENSITIDYNNKRDGDFEKFAAGNDILIHVSASLSPTKKLGKYLVAKILLAADGVLTLDKDFSTVLTNAELDYYYVQAITFANFDCLTLSTGGIITAPTFNPYHFHGGIVAIKCEDTLKFDGGSISLSDCGIPITRRNSLRPLLDLETEQAQLDDRFLLNSGDGAAFIIANNIICHDDSRIGNLDTQGRYHCRGDTNLTPNVTNLGGSSLIIVAKNFSNFTPKILAKYRSNPVGKGYASCYIATDTKIPQDGELYNLDCISDKSRLQKHGVKNFGRGKLSATNPDYKISNTAQIDYTFDKTCAYSNKTVTGLAAIQPGNLVVAHGDNFFVTEIASDDGKHITLADAVDAQEIISIAEFDNLSITNSCKQKNLAIMVKDTFDLSGKLFADNLYIFAQNFNLTGKISANKIFIAANQFSGDANIDNLQFIFCNEWR